MNFNAPISRGSQPEFHEGSGLRSVRDSDSTSQLWKKNKAVKNQHVSDGQALTALTREVGKLRRRIPGGYVPQTIPETYFPFKIYQPDQGLLCGLKAPIPAAIFDSSGNATKCNIDPSVPTDLGATPPTVNPKTDYWRLWCVRGGGVEVRSYYSSVGSVFNNYAGLTISAFGTDGIIPFDQSDNVTQNVIANSFFITNGTTYGYPDNNVYGGIIVMDGDPISNLIYYCFWLEITPDLNSSQIPLVRVKGRRFTGGIGYNNEMPAMSSFLIPIAIMGTDSTQSSPYVLTTLQLTFNHFIGRFTTSTTNFGDAGSPSLVTAPPTQADLYNARMAGPMNFRGNWDVAAIQDMVFYPGDVINYSGGLYMATTICVTTNPSADNNFNQIL